jgi:MFS family permease
MPPAALARTEAASTPAALAADGGGVPRRALVAAVLGNGLEFYDFLAYATFAIYIGNAFFPSSTPHASLLKSVAVFGVGFFTRPLGGLLIGRFADRAGRRPALLLTFTLMAAGTLALALTPSHAAIGDAAPWVVVGARLVQGFALGGEVGPSSAFLVEAAGTRRRGYVSAWQSASQGVAFLVAGLIGAGLTAFLTTTQLQEWGWRVPFALALPLLPVGLYMRSALPETLHRAASAEPGSTPARAPRPAALRHHGRAMTLSILLVMGGTVTTYVNGYMTTYAISVLKMPPTVSMAASVMVGVCTLVFALVGGAWSDRAGRKPVMLWPRVLATALYVPCFLLLNRAPSPVMLLGVTAVLSVLTAITAAATLVAIPEMFPAHVRASGMSVAYALAVAVFGGTTQYIITWLIGVTQDPIAPAWYVVASGLVCIAAIVATPETCPGKQREPLS